MKLLASLILALLLAACANGDPLSVPQGTWQPVNVPPPSLQAGK